MSRQGHLLDSLMYEKRKYSQMFHQNVACLIVALILSGCGVFQYADPCNCVSPPKAIFYRNDAKNETQFHHYGRSPDTITVHDIASWQDRFDADYPAWKSEVDSTSRRRVGTPEDSLYVLKGRLVFARQMLDCDFHMEIIPFE